MLYRKNYLLNISVVLFLVYFLQGIAYPSGSLISQTILLLYVCIGAVCFVKTCLYKRTPLAVKTLILFYIFLTLSFIISPKAVIGTNYEAIGVVHTFDQFKNISLCILSFFIPYSTIVKKSISINNILFIFFTFLFLSLVRYAYSIGLHYDNESFTNNSGYYLVSLIPFLPIVIKKNRIIGVTSIIIITYLTILSSKRGAIVCLIISLAILIFLYFKNRKIKLLHILAFTIIICGLGVFIYKTIISNEYLISRLEYTADSGIGPRSIAYKTIWQHWLHDTNIISILFGNGMASSVTVWGNYAHNDWLELLISNGVIGVSLYAVFFISTFFYIKKSKLDNTYKVSAYLCFIIWFLKTVFSMGYTDSVNIFITILLGILLGSNEYYKQNIEPIHISNFINKKKFNE